MISSINQDNSIIEQSSITEHNASIYQNIQDNSQSHGSTENTQDNPALNKTNMYMKIPSSITNQDGYLEEDELALTIQLKNEPNTYKQAIESYDKDEWLKGMNKEITNLELANTWSIVDRPKDKETVQGRWVYRLKKALPSNIYKGRWVVKCFEQTYGLDKISRLNILLAL